MNKCESLKNLNIGQSAAKSRIGKRSETSRLRRSFNLIIETKRGEINYIYFLKDSIMEISLRYSPTINEN